jgi:hypothetical protein
LRQDLLRDSSFFKYEISIANPKMIVPQNVMKFSAPFAAAEDQVIVNLGQISIANKV